MFNDNRITISRSSITGNRVTAGDGGGLWNNFRMTVDDSTIVDNAASDHGGGVTNAQLGRATFNRSTIKRNTAVLVAAVSTTSTLAPTSSSTTAPSPRTRRAMPLEACSTRPETSW
ncbi:hypothetical protein ACFQ51_14635 [Streptomyces kaempferi]